MKKGFTLVELVIVIAVIAILAGVLIPTFGGIVEKANDNAAMQEARNLYTEYLAGEAGTGVVDDELYVKIGEKGYVAIKKGVVSVNETTGKYLIKLADLPTGSDTLEKQTATATTPGYKYTCSHVGEANAICSKCGKTIPAAPAQE